jgi:hypothetical protein
MTVTATVPRGWRFADHVPYDVPESLDLLRGPTTGSIRVSPHINTSPNPVYDLSDDNMVWHLYSAVVREGTPEEQSTLLDRATLERLWPTLNLPERCRQLWEDAFPRLAHQHR